MEDMMGMALGFSEEYLSRQLREEIHRMIDVVGIAYLEDLKWTVQQYAAKSLNEQIEDRKHNRKC